MKLKLGSRKKSLDVYEGKRKRERKKERERERERERDHR